MGCAVHLKVRGGVSFFKGIIFNGVIVTPGYERVLK